MSLKNEVDTGRVVYNDESGSSQSELLADYTKISYTMITTLAKVLYEGARYDEEGEPPNWLGISEKDHLNHCVHHIYSFLACGELEDIEHAFCRLAMAVHMERNRVDDEEY